MYTLDKSIIHWVSRVMLNGQAGIYKLLYTVVGTVMLNISREFRFVCTHISH